MADPTITSLSTALTEGGSVVITGTNFGSKSPAKPIYWADFEGGIQPTSLGDQTTWDEYTDERAELTATHLPTNSGSAIKQAPKRPD